MLKSKLKNGSAGAVLAPRTDPKPVTKSWVKAEDLRPGDEIILADGSTAVVESVTADKERSTVYNFAVDVDHTYFVGQATAWVHNSCLEEQPPFEVDGVLDAPPPLDPAEALPLIALDQLRQRTFTDLQGNSYSFQDLENMDPTDVNRLKFFTVDQLTNPASATGDFYDATPSMLQELARFTPQVLITTWARVNVDTAILAKIEARQEITLSDIGYQFGYEAHHLQLKGPSTIYAVQDAFNFGADPVYPTDPEALGIERYLDIDDQLSASLANPDGPFRAAYNLSVLIGEPVAFDRPMTFMSSLSEYGAGVFFDLWLDQPVTDHGAAIWGRFGGTVSGTLSAQSDGRFDVAGELQFGDLVFDWEGDAGFFANIGLGMLADKLNFRPGASPRRVPFGRDGMYRDIWNPNDVRPWRQSNHGNVSFETPASRNARFTFSADAG